MKAVKQINPRMRLRAPADLFVSMKFTIRASEVVRCAHSEVLRLRRKVKLSVPHPIARSALHLAKPNFTSEGHFTFRRGGTLS